MPVKRILLRGRKTPFDTNSPGQTLDRNLAAGNSGNLLFLEAAFKLLSANDVEVQVEGGPPRVEDAPRINEQYDAYVVPLANAFRSQFLPQLTRLTQLIEQLRIPVVILGVGAQSDVGYGTDALRPLEAQAKAFCKVVLARSPVIGVRGEFTYDYVRSLGFDAVEVIGCPSMFWYGPQLAVNKRHPSLTPAERLAVSASPGVRLDSFLRRTYEAYPRLEFIAQDIDTLTFLLTGKGLRESHREIVLERTHPLFRDDRVLFFLDPLPWIEHLRDFAFCCGTRIHGNVAALLAGTPAYVLAHDSRTLELARYFEIPHTSSFDADGVDPARLYESADYGPVMAGHGARFARLEGFLQRHGLRHIYQEAGAAEAFDARLLAVPFPPPVRARSGAYTPAAEAVRRAARTRLSGAMPGWLRSARRALRSGRRPH